MSGVSFSGEYGVGFSMAHRLNTATPLYISGG
jgi:hypothetical protein